LSGMSVDFRWFHHQEKAKAIGEFEFEFDVG
jgi:hypothetical protein